MIIFPAPQIARDGLDRTPVFYLCLTLTSTGTIPNIRTTIDAYSSTDGLVYKQRRVQGDLVTIGNQGLLSLSTDNLIVSDGRFILVTAAYKVVGLSGTYRTAIFTSENGWQWTLRATPFDSPIPSVDNIPRGICKFGSALVVILYTGGTIISTDNGTTWFAGASTGFGDNRGIAASSSAVVVVTSTGQLVSSTDPASAWIERTSQFGSTTINAITSAEDIFVAVGGTGKISTGSLNGQTWTARSSGVTAIFSRIINTGTVFYTAGSADAAAWRQSADGQTWGAPSSNYWDGGSFGQIIRHVRGASGRNIIYWANGVAYSDNETTWQQAPAHGLPTGVGMTAAYRPA